MPTFRLASRLRRSAVGAGALFAVGAAPASPARPAAADTAASVRQGQPAVDSARAAPAVPWGVGEQLDYDVKFGIIRAGSASLQLPDVVDVRGRPAYHAVFRISGGALFYHVDDLYESWIDTTTLASLRFWQTQLEGGKRRIKHYEIFPDREVFQDGQKPEERSVAEPLDDASFFYFVRTLPLRDGDVYEFNRYFKADRNPVRIRVLRREQVSVPAGKFNAVVVQPTFKTKGYFSEGGRAEVWISDDPDRVVLRLQAGLPVGSLTMQLRRRQPGHKAE